MMLSVTTPLWTMKDPHGGFVLAEEHALGLARDGRGARVESANQLGIGEKRSGVKLHRWTFPEEKSSS